MTREYTSFQITASIELCLRDIDIHNNVTVTAESGRTIPFDPTLTPNLCLSTEMSCKE